MTEDPYATPKSLPAELTRDEWLYLERLARHHGLTTLADKCAQHAKAGKP